MGKTLYSYSGQVVVSISGQRKVVSLTDLRIRKNAEIAEEKVEANSGVPMVHQSNNESPRRESGCEEDPGHVRSNRVRFSSTLVNSLSSVRPTWNASTRPPRGSSFRSRASPLSDNSSPSMLRPKSKDAK